MFLKVDYEEFYWEGEIVYTVFGILIRIILVLFFNGRFRVINMRRKLELNNWIDIIFLEC